MECSLILATLGRDIELARFLKSLASQTYRDFELIIIDQNQDNKIDSIVEKSIGCFPVKQIKVDFSGVAKARDYGIQHARGKIIAFPDDDCVYEVDVLERVVDEFERKEELAILVGGLYDFSKTKFSVGTNSYKHKKFSHLNIMGVECTHFFNLSKINKKHFYFDHDFGIGSKYFSGEGFELLYRLMRAGYKAFYAPDIRIYHANMDKEDHALNGNRIFKYSFGMGAFVRKFANEGDPLMIYYILRKMFVAPIFKILLAVFLFNPKKLSYSYNNFKGVWQGFFAYGK
jgi:glycosyltransferase involved in cell wall biosynthesis